MTQKFWGTIFEMCIAGTLLMLTLGGCMVLLIKMWDHFLGDGKEK